jgi:hypothetical protein
MKVLPSKISYGCNWNLLLKLQRYFCWVNLLQNHYGNKKTFLELKLKSSNAISWTPFSEIAVTVVGLEFKSICCVVFQQKLASYFCINLTFKGIVYYIFFGTLKAKSISTCFLQKHRFKADVTSYKDNLLTALAYYLVPSKKLVSSKGLKSVTVSEALP